MVGQVLAKDQIGVRFSIPAQDREWVDKRGLRFKPGASFVYLKCVNNIRDIFKKSLRLWRLLNKVMYVPYETPQFYI